MWLVCDYPENVFLSVFLNVFCLNYLGVLGTPATAYFQMIQEKKKNKQHYLYNTVLVAFSIFGFQNNISTLKTIIEVAS